MGDKAVNHRGHSTHPHRSAFQFSGSQSTMQGGGNHRAQCLQSQHTFDTFVNSLNERHLQEQNKLKMESMQQIRETHFAILERRRSSIEKLQDFASFVHAVADQVVQLRNLEFIDTSDEAFEADRIMR